MIIYLSLLVAVVGLLIWVLSKDAKVQEVGKIMLLTGLLAFLLQDSALLNVLRR
jgi:hypothetical protein